MGLCILSLSWRNIAVNVSPLVDKAYKERLNLGLLYESGMLSRKYVHIETDSTLSETLDNPGNVFEPLAAT